MFLMATGTTEFQKMGMQLPLERFIPPFAKLTDVFTPLRQQAGIAGYRR